VRPRAEGEALIRVPDRRHHLLETISKRLTRRKNKLAEAKPTGIGVRGVRY
jgi:hypothetical protein